MRLNITVKIKLSIMIIACTAAVLPAQDALQSLQPLTVTGGEEKIFELPGSASLISAAEFTERGYTTFAQIAARTPGVYVQREDSFGNFINVSIRGVDGTRANKVTMMEDGILTSPSPYSNPSAYYSPKVGRMAGIEILKGSSQVRYGPQTTGGVVNFLSTPIPEGDGPNFYSRNTYGSHNTFFNHLWYGDTVETANGRFGYLFEMHQQSSDGFRKTDGSSKKAGFDLLEPMVKLFWEPNTALKQRFEFKFGYTDFDMDDSYPGVTEQDLRRDYNRRYAVSALDTFDSDATRSYLRWIAEPSEMVRLENTLYYNTFNRAFYRLNDVRLGASNALGGGTNISAAQALMNPDALAVLQGLGNGTVRRLSNIREHEAFGWQSQANFRFDTGAIGHDLAAGVRVHHDNVQAIGQDFRFRSDGAGGFFEVARAPEQTKGNLEEVTAVALFLEDEIRLNSQFTLRPGIRYEFLEYQQTSAAGNETSGDANLLMGGIGANYELDESNSIFSGLYQGSTPPNVGGYLNGTKAEKSLSYEIGYRHRRDDFRAELVGFHTSFRDLITPQVGISTGDVVNDTNGGEATSYGIEALVEYDAGADLTGGAFGLPVYLSATWTRARFDLPGGTRLTQGVFAGAEDGSEIPYVPEWRIAAGIGLTSEKWAVNLDASYVNSTWASGWNGRTPTGTPTSTDGKIDSMILFDLSGHYQLNENVKLVGGVHNLLDERALVSRHPQGPRGNSPRMVFAGAEFTF
jgi:Fe(3+) dicitrate transport protein